jgi:hypothetical protein
MSNQARQDKPLSAVLQEVAEAGNGRITIGQLADSFGGRALGALLLVFGLACTLPLPPGATTVFGLPLVFLGPQLLFGARGVWMPDRLRRRGVDATDLRRGLPRVLPWLRRAENVSRPRLHFLFSDLGQRAIGLVCTLLALVLILPIPFGNLLPGAAVSVMALSLLQRDGALLLLGYGLTLASAGVLVLAAGLIGRGAGGLLALLPFA